MWCHIHCTFQGTWRYWHLWYTFSSIMHSDIHSSSLADSWNLPFFSPLFLPDLYSPVCQYKSNGVLAEVKQNSGNRKLLGTETKSSVDSGSHQTPVVENQIYPSLRKSNLHLVMDALDFYVSFSPHFPWFPLILESHSFPFGYSGQVKTTARLCKHNQKICGRDKHSIQLCRFCESPPVQSLKSCLHGPLDCNVSLHFPFFPLKFCKFLLVVTHFLFPFLTGIWTDLRYKRQSMWICLRHTIRRTTCPVVMWPIMTPQSPQIHCILLILSSSLL